VTRANSKERTDNCTKAIDMVRQLRISEIHQLKDSMKKVRTARARTNKGSMTHRQLRRMATDGSLLAKMKAAGLPPRTPPGRSTQHGGGGSGRADSAERDFTSVGSSGSPLVHSDITSTRVVGVDKDRGGHGHVVQPASPEQQRPPWSLPVGVKGVVEEGEGESESDFDTTEDEDDEEEEEEEQRQQEEEEEEEEEGESGVDTNNINYVQNFLLRRRKTSDLFSLTRRLNGGGGSSSSGAAIARSSPALLLPRQASGVVLHEYDERLSARSTHVSDDDDDEEDEDEDDEDEDEDNDDDEDSD
jgi:hypothetical protein